MSVNTKPEWHRGLLDECDPEYRRPCYEAWVEPNLRARIEMVPFWSGDCRRAKCQGWHLFVGNVQIFFEADDGDRGGRKALAAAKEIALRSRRSEYLKGGSA